MATSPLVSLSPRPLCEEPAGQAELCVFDRPTGRLENHLRWTAKLRWTAVAGPLATMALVWAALGVELSWAPMCATIAVTAASNVFLMAWLKYRRVNGWEGQQRRGTWLLRGLLTLDTFALTGLLYASGGPTNPFSVFFLLNVALAATVLEGRWAWGLYGLAVACYAGLFVEHTPLPCLACSTRNPGGDWLVPRASGTEAVDLHLRGMLVALAMAGAVIVYFIRRVTASRERLEAELRRAHERKERLNKVEAMATLAAGAAHELGTPLATIAVATRELEVHLQSYSAPAAAVDDARLIGREVARCRRILDGMASASGGARGEEFARITVGQMLDAALAELPGAHRIHKDISKGVGERICRVPQQALSQALRALIQNAVNASPPGKPVRIEVCGSPGMVCIRIIDRGSGMTAEVLERVGEPLFTTKEPGSGMGLGVYLARRVLTWLNGSLDYKHTVGGGITTKVRVPLAIESLKRAWRHALLRQFDAIPEATAPPYTPRNHYAPGVK